MTAGRHTFTGLDGLRGLAALAVMVFHLSRAAFPGVLPSAHLMVDLFFMLSGFVLAHAYGERLRAGGAFWGYLKARLIRLYPMHVAGAALGVAFFAPRAVAAFGEGTIAKVAVFHLLMAPTPDGLIGTATLFPYNAALWSLFYELGASVAFGLFARWLGVRTAAALTLGSGALLLQQALHFGSMGVGWTWPTLLGGAARVGFGFGAGMLLHAAWRGGRIAPRAGREGAWLLAGVAVLTLLAVTPRRAGVPYEFALVVLVWPILTAAAAAAERLPAQVARVCALIGLWSYPMYVLHLPISYFLNRAWRLQTGDAAAQAGLPLVLLQVACIVAASHLAATLYDGPVRGWLTRRLNRRGVGATAEVARPSPSTGEGSGVGVR